jgi:hypothetical protein
MNAPLTLSGSDDASPGSLARGSSPSAGSFCSGSVCIHAEPNVRQAETPLVGSPRERQQTESRSARPAAIPFSDHSRSAIRDYDPRKPSLPDLLCVICNLFHRYAPHCPECGHTQLVTE